MKRAILVRRAVLGAMAVVTLWSLWAWAEPMTAGKAATGGPGAGAVTAAPESEETPGPINWTEFGTATPPFIATLLNFGILAAGYYLLGKKPIAQALKNRRDAISKEIDEAQAMKHEAEARAKTYQAKLERLEEEVRTARDALVRAGEAERDRIVKDAEAKAERMRRDAEFMIEQEMKQIRVDLWRDAVDAAVASAETLLKERVTAADQERLAEDYLTELGKQAGGPRS